MSAGRGVRAFNYSSGLMETCVVVLRDTAVYERISWLALAIRSRYYLDFTALLTLLYSKSAS